LLVAPSPLLVVAGPLPPLGAGKYIAALDAMRGDFFCQAVEISAEGSLTAGASWRESRTELERRAAETGATIAGPTELDATPPHARGFAILIRDGVARQVELTTWEPDYGRKAEAQVRWVAVHGRALGGV
jgi:tRNA threonylcarbamoyladenosine biosynthesis protein TsaB